MGIIVVLVIMKSVYHVLVTNTFYQIVHKKDVQIINFKLDNNVKTVQIIVKLVQIMIYVLAVKMMNI